MGLLGNHTGKCGEVPTADKRKMISYMDTRADYGQLNPYLVAAMHRRGVICREELDYFMDRAGHGRK